MKLFNSKTIAIANQKGGVGKTTTAFNIASYLSITETPTLLIDMDPQANATSGLGVEIDNNSKTIYDAIIDDAKAEECIHKTNLKYLDVMPSTYSLVGAEIELVPQMKREDRLKNVINQIEGKYKYIIITNCCKQLYDNQNIINGDWRQLTAKYKPLNNFNPQILGYYNTKEISIIQNNKNIIKI